MPGSSWKEVTDCRFDLHQDTINHRRHCGEGECDVGGFVDCLLSAGYNGPWGIEVLSEEIRDRHYDALATRAFNMTMAQFPDGKR
jgi:sugar phosphate isomerase/epimerase